MTIDYLKHNQIDKKKWDENVFSSYNGLVSANSWYLDIVSPNWSALVANDYKIIMPLTHRSKYGISYLFKPFFSQFLGVFYQNKDDSKYVKQFIDKAAEYYKHVHININVHNSNFDAEYTNTRQTQVLDLSLPYQDFKKKYNRSNKKNIRKSWETDVEIRVENNPDQLIELIKLMYIDRGVKGIKENDYKDLGSIIKYAVNNNLGEINFAYSKDRICAGAFFFKWKNRVILQTGINDLGKEKLAIFRIMDNYFQLNAGKDLLFDFAGSNIPGVAYWNSGFGAETQLYYNIQINNLPWILKLFKK